MAQCTLSFACTLLVVFGAQAQTQTLSERVDSLLAKWNHSDAPGTAVLIVRNGRIEYRRGFGLADLKRRSPITPDTQFQLESVSKQFTAMGIMILADRYKLSFEDPLSKFCPEFPAYARSITIRHLLNHSSGLRDYDLGDDPDEPSYFRSFDAPRAAHEYTASEALRALSLQPRLSFPPGYHFEYSNAGYMLLAQIIERVSGMRFSDFLQDAIFTPLGMKDTVVLDERNEQRPKRLALGYASTSDGWRDVSYFPTIYVYGHRGVISTINDLYKWDQALNTDRLVSHSTLETAFTPGTANDGRELVDPEMSKMMKRKVAYGFGWDVSSLGGEKTVEHTGRGIGYSAYIIRLPVQKITIVLLSNFVNPDRFETARQMIELIRGESNEGEHQALN
jgi:CubicO group peptidase (beta-lactamase class C family)